MQLQGTASRQGCVPGGPFAQVMQEWVKKELDDIARSAGLDIEFLRRAYNYPESNLPPHPMERLSELLGMDIDNARKIKNGKREWIGFDIADKIVAACTDGLGWRNDPELAAIYQNFSFEWLDRAKPCVVAA